MASTSLSIQRQREILDGPRRRLARLRKKTCRKGTRIEQVKPDFRDIVVVIDVTPKPFRRPPQAISHATSRPKLHRLLAVLGQRTGPTTHQINAMNTMDRERIRGRIRPRPVWGSEAGWDHDSPEPAREMRRRNCTVNGLSRRGFVPGGGGCSCTSGASLASDTPARRAECRHVTMGEMHSEAGRRTRSGIPRQEEVQQPGLRRGGSLAPAVKLENQKRPATDTIRTGCELPVPSPRSDRSKRRICRNYSRRSWVTAPLHSLTMMAGVFLVVALLGLPVPVVTPVLAQPTTAAPTTSSPPSLSSAPTVSLMPSAQPSVSLMPSAVPTVSLAPSAAPSISSQPSAPPTALDSDKDGIPDSSDQVSLLYTCT